MSSESITVGPVPCCCGSSPSSSSSSEASCPAIDTLPATLLCSVSGYTGSCASYNETVTLTLVTTGANPSYVSSDPDQPHVQIDCINGVWVTNAVFHAEQCYYADDNPDDAGLLFYLPGAFIKSGPSPVGAYAFDPSYYLLAGQTLDHCDCVGGVLSVS
jgi:hypothetical protein